MQINNSNYQISPPNFQARYLSRSISTAAKNRAEAVIDIYSLNKNDKNFIERVLNLLKGRNLPEDKLAISGRDQKASVKEALNKALKYDGDSDNKVLIAIEDNKNIVGIADYSDYGDICLNTLYMFKNGIQNIGRKSLLLQMLKYVKSRGDVSADIKAERLNNEAKKYYSNLGFIKDKLSSIVELTIFSDDIANKINKIETGSSFNMKKTRFTQKEFDLAEIMKLD